MNAPVTGLESRTFYQQTRRIRPAIFLPMALATLAVALLMAVSLHFLFIYGWYWIMITPAIVAIPVGAMLYFTVKLGWCRSRWNVLPLALLATLVLYGGHFHVGLLSDAGPDYLWRFDLLPDYIKWRTENTVIRDVHSSSSSSPSPPTSFGIAMNWAFTGFDTFIVFIAIAAAAVGQSMIPFDETTRRWARTASRFVPGDARVTVIQALARGEPKIIPLLFKPNPILNPPFTRVDIQYLDAPRDQQPRPVYLSVSLVKQSLAANQPRIYIPTNNRHGLRQMELNHDEIAALSPLFPELAGVIGQEAVDAATAEIKSAVNAPTPAPTPADRPAIRATVETSPVPPNDANTIFTPSVLRKGKRLYALRFFPWPLGLLLGAVGVTIMLEFGHPGTGGAGVDMVDVVAFALIGVGVALLYLAQIITPRICSKYKDRYYERVAREVLALRPRRWVEPNDPRTIFVAVAPHQSEDPAIRPTEPDMGLLLLDDRKKQIVFEGDRQRFRIPFSLLQSCDAMAVSIPGSRRGAQAFFTLLRARHGDQFWEVALIPYLPAKGYAQDLFANRARELARRIAELSPAPSAPPR